MCSYTTLTPWVSCRTNILLNSTPTMSLIHAPDRVRSCHPQPVTYH